VLRDQGVSYQADISQISYLLFLKMDEEREAQLGEPSMLPAGSRWADIKELAGEALAAKYGKALEMLSRQPGVIGDFPQGAEQSPRPGQAQPARRPDRLGDLA